MTMNEHIDTCTSVIATILLNIGDKLVFVYVKYHQLQKLYPRLLPSVCLWTQ